MITCEEMALAVEAKGVATSDVRDWEMLFHMDAYVVRLWNRRKILVTGLDLFRASR